ncbi:MAG TPA: MFS transporter [Anaeromyxobacter sp.]|nr:MFS transporter [Anaeromyxobacter sp.]
MHPPATSPAPTVRPWAAFSAIAVGTLMATIDGNIVNVALPTLGVELRAHVDALQWIVNGYLIAITATLVVMGRLGDRLGHRALYAGGLVVFTLGSALCGLAPGLGALVGARVIQALGASAMMAIGPAVVTASFPPEMRGRALGAVGTVVAVGLTVGAPLGGLILSHLSWRWVFYVNLPVGIAGVAWALRVLPRGGGVGGPLLDAALFRIPAFSLGLAAGLLSYAAMFSQTFLTPFLLARVLRVEPGRLGLVLSAVPIALAVSSPLAGWLSDRFGARRLPAFGMALLAAALSTLSLAGASSTVASVAAHLFVAGVGMGLFQAPNNATVMGALPRARLGSGGGLLATARNAGMAAGVALAGTLFATRAGPDTAGPEFLDGYALALRAGAALAVAAAAVSLVKVGAPTPERTP